jgi:RNA polymerase sigma-70 factor, ECF subfamily
METGFQLPQHLSSDEERALIAQLPTNPEAFRRLYRHYAPLVFGYVAYRVGSKQDAEDLTADIFLKIVKSISRFEYRAEKSFAVWVFRIAHNTVQQFYRTLQRRQTLLLDDLPEIESTGLLPDERLVRQEEFARLHQVIITLRFFGGLRNQDIAAILNLDERTVASHLSRGLKALEHKYQQEEKSYE